MKVIKVIEFADGSPCPIAGQYVKSFDFEAHNGVGFGTFTRDPHKAMKFDNVGAALTFWQTTSKTKPKRRDGKPNRPFTSTTVEIVEAPIEDQ